MKFRKPLPKNKSSRRKFSNNANKTKSLNIKAHPMRGGIRL